jgi:hypothetical protein
MRPIPVAPPVTTAVTWETSKRRLFLRSALVDRPPPLLEEEAMVRTMTGSGWVVVTVLMSEGRWDGVRRIVRNI